MSIITEETEMKLDVGCGGKGSRRDGFIGIDIHPRPDGKTAEEYVRMDFVKDDLQWEENSIDEVIALHIIEHLSREEGVILLKRCFWLLKEGATMTVTCPDLMRIATAYVEHDTEYMHLRHEQGKSEKEIWKGKTNADRLNWSMHCEGHKWSYDYETLLSACAEAGIPLNDVEMMREGNKYNFRPDHETGIIVRKETNG